MKRSFYVVSENPTRIYLVRHGETASNVEGLFRGRSDIPLNDNGLEQARDLADVFRKYPFDAVYSSPLSRAMETAKAIVANRPIAVVSIPDFNNIDLGEWTGRPKSEIEKEYPELWEQWITVPEELVIPGGEKIMSVRKRSFEALQKLTQKHMGGCFAVVSHRAVLKPLIAAILNMALPFFWRLHLDTASFTIFEHTEKRGYVLTCFNSTHHLKKYVIEKV